MGGVEVPPAPWGGRGIEWGVGRGYLHPHWGRVCPLPRKFFVFFAENTIF